MQRLDRMAIDEVGIPSMVLMETAGRAVADAAEARADELDGSVLVLAGLGNNGGDAVVVARHLHNRGVDVELVLLGDPSRASPDLVRQLAIAAKLELHPQVILSEDAAELAPLLARHPIIVDGLFGTGLTRAIEGRWARAIELVNASPGHVIAIDIPSGIDADTGGILGVGILAAETITFGLPKLGHLLHPGRAHAGVTRVVDIGIPFRLLGQVVPRAWLLDDQILADAFPPRAPDDHKGRFGHLLVIAGSPDRPGSALLAARAALRVGTGLVTLASDDETVRRAAPALDELMGLSLGPTIDAAHALPAISSRDALVIGMSLTAEGEVRDALREIIAQAEVPIVADAGALDALAPDLLPLSTRRRPAVLTPHPGEMARLIASDSKSVQRDRVGVARDVAAKSGAIVVLKGASTLIAEPDGTIAVVPTGNPGMASGGMGDVLAGIIGGLLAQGLPAALAARAGAYLHGLAGDRAAAERGMASLVASDLLLHLEPRAEEADE